MNGPDGAGARLFAQFAYPPNDLGYCGPDAAGTLLEHAHGGTAGGRTADGGMRSIAARFEGAWPYLELIARSNGLSDPLDVRVVEAYWLGNELLDAVDLASQGSLLDARLRPAAGGDWSGVAEAAGQAPRPHHNLHVLCVYPFAGLLGSGATDHALHVLDQCRIRWGRVSDLADAAAVVNSVPLTWDGRRLALGPPRPETIEAARDGRALTSDLAVGDVVACHWGWVCHRLTPGQAHRLQAETEAQLDLVNRQPTGDR